MYGYPSEDDHTYDPLGVNQPAASGVSGDEDAPAPRSPFADAPYLTVEAYLWQCYEMLVDPRQPRACLPGISDQPTRNAADQLFRTHQIASYLPHADFTLYNEAYHNNNDHDCCGTCYGKSGTLETDIEGDGVYATHIERLVPCDDCLGASLCAGCMQPLALSFDASGLGDYVYRYPAYNGVGEGDGYFTAITPTYEYAIAALPIDGFTCLVCGWQFSADQLYDFGDYGVDGFEARADYYDDDPGFDPMFLM